MRAITPTELNKRTQDKWGSGEFGAPRGDHTHHGIDYVCPVNSEILAPVSGKVTKLGYPYADDLSFRYVQLTAVNGYDHRIFYILPCVRVGEEIKEGQTIGYSQDLGQRYPGITQHLHYEVKHAGQYLNPEEV
jgi:murein DD-endopeptidase MepM/ murein hydrolase activator NlpD